MLFINLYCAVAEVPPYLIVSISESNSSHVNVTVSWESPADPVTGYVIYYQTKGGPVISDMVSGGETETHSLDGLQRGVTYYISILALSQHLPSPLVGNVTVVGESFPSPSSHHVLLSLDPLLVVETSPESLITSPNTQFSLNCTARAMLDGEIVPLSLKIEWDRIPQSDQLMSTQVEGVKMGIVSTLTTTEDGSVKRIIYRCTTKSIQHGSHDSSNITVYVESVETPKATPSLSTLNMSSVSVTTISSPHFTATIYSSGGEA